MSDRMVFMLERGEGNLSHPVVLFADQVAGFTTRDETAWGTFSGTPRSESEPEVLHWQADMLVVAILSGGGEQCVGMFDASGPVKDMHDRESMQRIHALAVVAAEEWIADLTARLSVAP